MENAATNIVNLGFVRNNAEIQMFENAQFGSVRIIMEDDKPLFCGGDVAEALGYSNRYDALARHCRYVVKRDIPHPQSPDKKMGVAFISEGDVYRLIVRSKLPSAERFERWVFDEVLPSIRRSGGYLAGQDMLTDEELLSRAMMVAQKTDRTARPAHKGAGV